MKDFESTRACHGRRPNTPRIRHTGALLLVVTGWLFTAGIAHAQQQPAQGADPSTADVLSRTRLLIEESRYQEALATLRQATDLDKSQRAEMRELLGVIYWGQGRYGSSIRAYENLLSLEDLPPSARVRAFQALAQLYTIEENHSKALEYLDRWAQAARASETTAKEPKPATGAKQPMPAVEKPELDTALERPSGKVIDGAVSSANFQSSLEELDLSVKTDEYQPVVRVAPVYPKRAVETGIEGYVIIECTVTESGSVKNATVVESTNPVLDRAALNAVKQFKFNPRVVDGEYVEVTGVRQKVIFRLE